MSPKNITIRKAKHTDFKGIKSLHQDVARTPGGIARVEAEITDSYVEKILVNSLSSGLMLLAETKQSEIVGSIHAYRIEPKAFRHIFTKLTIAVHPDHQGKGVGKFLFTEFLRVVEEDFSDILRVELIVRESNEKAILFYEKLGFRREGKMMDRVHSVNGDFEADIPMAWMNPRYKGK